MLAVQVKGGRPGTGSEGGTPRIWIVANNNGRCIDSTQLDRGKNDERGAMGARHLLTAVKAKEYPPAIWSRAIAANNLVRQCVSGQRKEEGEGDHVNQG